MKEKAVEGCAVFYDRSKFREMEKQDFDFKTALVRGAGCLP